MNEMSALAKPVPKAQPVKPAPQPKAQPAPDYDAYVLDMNSKADSARDRWNVVCSTYTEAWDAAMKTQNDVLDKVKENKAAREKREKEQRDQILAFAYMFLPMVGGAIAFRLAPILTTRAQLFVSTMSKKLGGAWATTAASHPIVAKVVQEIGSRGTNKATAAMESIKKDIIGALEPKATSIEAPPRNRTPLESFKERNILVRAQINDWVNRWSTVNVSGEDWQKALIPVAHAMLLSHPWITTAPPEAQTLARREAYTRFFELVFWTLWGQNLDGPYWYNVDEWYRTKFDGKSKQARVHELTQRKQWVFDLVELEPIYLHFRSNMPREFRYHFGQMRILDPTHSWIAPSDMETINPYTAFKKSREEKIADQIMRVLPDSGYDRDFLKEMRALLIPSTPLMSEIMDGTHAKRLKAAGQL
jgi:hypothetical protein